MDVAEPEQRAVAGSQVRCDAPLTGRLQGTLLNGERIKTETMLRLVDTFDRRPLQEGPHLGHIFGML